MESMEKIERALARFIDKEMYPVMPKVQGIAFAAFAPLVIQNKKQELLHSPLVQAMGVVDGENVDVDKLYAAFKGKAQGQWPMDAFGFKVTEADFDKLYRYIKEA